MTLLCSHCGTSFNSEPARHAKYCSRACYFAARYVDPLVRKEQASLKSKAKYLANRKEMLARQLQYRTEHPERFRAVQRRHKTIHHEKILSRTRELYAVNREKILKRKQAWYKAHPEAGVHQRNKRRALKNNSPRNDLTCQQWQDIQAAQNHCCAYCKKRCKGRLTQDHITPLSKGGSHTLHNVIGACKSCNSRKWTRDILSPVQPLLL